MARQYDKRASHQVCPFKNYSAANLCVSPVRRLASQVTHVILMSTPRNSQNCRDAPRPVGASRANCRQPGNKPPSFERSVWAAPGWRRFAREFLRRRESGDRKGAAAAPFPAAARQAADKKLRAADTPDKNKVGRKTCYGLRPTFFIPSR